MGTRFGIAEMPESKSLWTTADKSKWFLVPNHVDLAAGSTIIRDLNGDCARVDLQQLCPFEVAEAEAIQWARRELAESLGELKQNIDAKLADWRRQLEEFKHSPVKPGSEVTPEAATVFFDFLKQLPQVFRDSVSGDEGRMDSARKTAVRLKQQFNDAGLTADDRLKTFPARLAKIKEKTESKRRPQQKPQSE